MLLSADEHERQPAEEELGADRHDQRRDPDERHQHAVEQAGQDPTRERATTPSSTLPVACQTHDEADHAQGHDRREREVDVAATMTIVRGIATIAKYGVVCANER